MTNRQVYLRATIPGTSDASWRKAKNKLTEFRAQVLKQRTVASTVPFAHAVDEWMKTGEVVDSTRDGYLNHIKQYIRPALRKIAVRNMDGRVIGSSSAVNGASRAVSRRDTASRSWQVSRRSTGAPRLNWYFRALRTVSIRGRSFGEAGVAPDGYARPPTYFCAFLTIAETHLLQETYKIIHERVRL